MTSRFDHAQTVLPDGLLENRIGGQNIDLPALRLGDLAQAEDDAAGPAEAGVADNVKKLHRIRLS